MFCRMQWLVLLLLSQQLIVRFPVLAVRTTVVLDETAASEGYKGNTTEALLPAKFDEDARESRAFVDVSPKAETLWEDTRDKADGATTQEDLDPPIATTFTHPQVVSQLTDAAGMMGTRKIFFIFGCLCLGFVGMLSGAWLRKGNQEQKIGARLISNDALCIGGSAVLSKSNPKNADVTESLPFPSIACNDPFLQDAATRVLVVVSLNRALSSDSSLQYHYDTSMSDDSDGEEDEEIHEKEEEEEEEELCPSPDLKRLILEELPMKKEQEAASSSKSPIKPDDNKKDSMLDTNL